MKSFVQISIEFVQIIVRYLCQCMRRCASVVYAVVACPPIHPSVSLFVHPSQADTVSKNLNVGSLNFFFLGGTS